MPETREIVASGPPAEDARRNRRGWFVGAAVLVVLLGAYVVGALFTGDRVPRSTTVGGIDIGGLTRTEAEARLDATLGPRLAEPVEVTVGETVASIAAAEANLVLATSETVEEAAAGSPWNPMHIVRVLVGSPAAVDAEVRTDGDSLTAALEALAGQTDREPVDATVSFPDGTVAVTAPTDGSILDVAAARDAILRDALGNGPIALPVEATAPVIGSEQLQRALDTFAEPAMSGPVTITAGETEVPLAPADIAPFVTMSVNGDGLAPALDVDGLLAADPARFAGVIAPPVSASFTFASGAPTVVPAVEGTTIDPATLRVDLLAALAAVGAERVVEASTTTQEPDLTTAEAQALGIVELVSEFTTNYPILEYRLVNIGRAAELINGSLVLPGETFSLNETVGERTAENGFVKGFIIDGGQLREDLGGGVSQVATTTFNAVFFAGLEDVEHKPHSFYISRYPAGREATVAWPVVDLAFRNDTDTGVLIQTIHTPGEITVRFWGTKAYDEIRSVSSERYNITTGTTKYEDGEECVDQDPVSGFDITVTRQFVEGGTVVRSEDFETHYNPADEIICRPPPA
ncbi:MAG: VanW family protein [Actinomycetes bacterium]